jgi:hypothetical protein
VPWPGTAGEEAFPVSLRKVTFFGRLVDPLTKRYAPITIVGYYCNELRREIEARHYGLNGL